MDTSRSLVYKTLAFDSPARIPRDVWILPWARLHYPQQVDELITRYPSDFSGAPALGREVRTQGNEYGVGVYVDEWGCVFHNMQAGVIGEVKEAVVSTWGALDHLRIPTERFTFDHQAVNDFCRTSDKFVMAGCCPRPFERLQFLRGSQQLYYDLGEQSDELSELLRRVHEFYLHEMELWVTTEVDGVTFMDDWGAQNRLLISPRQWRELFKPLYKDYIDLAHAHGKKIFMHSDGFTADILPDLIELSLDALNTQLFTMDIEALGRQHRGKLTFWGEIDRQHILPFGEVADVEAAVRRVHEAFYYQGGVIAQCEFSAGGRPENVMQVYQTWDELA